MRYPRSYGKALNKPLMVIAVLCIAFVIVGSVGVRVFNQNKPKEKASSFTLGLVLSNMENPFFNTLAEGAQGEADRVGVKLSIVDSKDQSNLEFDHIKELADGGVDCLIVNPTDSDSVYKAVQYANNKKIPVITVDRTSNGGTVICHISSDNEQGGAMIAAYLLELTKNQGSYAEMRGIEGTSAAQTRSKGFNDIMAKDSNMSLAAAVTADFSREKGRAAMENLLKVHPSLTALFAHNDEMALGASEIAKSLGSPVLIFGFDGTDEALEAIKTGEMVATIAQKPDEMGAEAVRKAIAHLQGEEIETNVLVDVMLIKK